VHSAVCVLECSARQFGVVCVLEGRAGQCIIRPRGQSSVGQSLHSRAGQGSAVYVFLSSDTVQSQRVRSSGLSVYPNCLLHHARP
jgi:hypothetical protein